MTGVSGSRGVPEPFRVDLEPHRATIVVRVHGEVDLVTAQELRRRLGEVLESGFERIVLDLRPVSFMDSTGLRTVLEAHAASGRAGVDFALVPGPEGVQHLFEITATDTVLQFIDGAAIDR